MKQVWILFFLFCWVTLASQSRQGIGTWRSYLPYKYGWSVTQSPEAVYFGTQWALMKINKSDLSIEYFSKVDGLNDTEVASVAYSDAEKVLVIVYRNSNIDLVFKDEIVNLDQIKSNTQIVGDRSVYHIFILPPYAYLSTGFGLVQLNIEDREFGSTTFTHFRINNVTSFEQYLYMATSEGIYRIASDGSVNIADFSLWERLDVEWGLPMNYESGLIRTINNDLYAAAGESLYFFEDDAFTKLREENGYRVSYMTPVNDKILIGWQCLSGCNDKKMVMDSQGAIQDLHIACASKTLDAVADERGRIWLADENTGFKYMEDLSGPCVTILPDRPPTHNVSELDVYDRRLYVASGGVSPNYGYLFRTDGFYTNATDEWRSFNISNVPVLAERDMRDFLVVKVSPEGKAFIGTFWDGLIEWDDPSLTVYDQSNSSLQNSVVNPDRNRISGLAFDRDENLWILNHDAPNPVSVFTADGKWESFSIPYPTNVEHIVVDDNNNKWISIGGIGLLVYDSGPDMLSGSDDRFKLFNTSNSALTVNSINCLATDRQGAVWVGTTSGPVIFDCSNFIFDAHCQGNRLIVVTDGIAGELLGNENITTIAVDGGNRKWFGTTNGVFVQSSDGENQIHVFHSKNSPLFDNQIIDIGIDHLEGEVFIATNKGILSYKGEATEGSRFHSNNILVFPNPVRHDYLGPIAIRGLAENGLVKITDINGFLVFETRAIGGQAIWDGNDLSGRRASTGVYLVFSAVTRDFANPDSAVTKIMFIN